MMNSRFSSTGLSAWLFAHGLLGIACSSSTEPDVMTNALPEPGATTIEMSATMTSAASATAGRPRTGLNTAGTSAAVRAGAAGSSAATASAGANARPAQANTAAGAAAPSAGAAGAAMSSASAGAAGSAMSGAGVGGATPAGESQPDLGKGDGADVVTIGDSWMSFPANGGGIEAALDRSDTDYDHFAVPGTLLLNGQIPSQYDQAKQRHPKISTVILTAGGNDIMGANGCDTKEKCAETIQGIIDGLDELFMKMVQDGVTSTVYIVYSKSAGTGPKDTRPDVLPVPTICTMGKLRCLVVDTSDIIGTSDLVDGVHPTQAGCDRIAKRTLEMMEKQGVRR